MPWVNVLDMPDDQRAEAAQQQADEEQQLQEVLDAAYRIDQEISYLCSYFANAEKYRVLRQSLETLALHGGYLNLLHKPLR